MSALGNPWRKNLGLPNRSLEPSLAHRRELAAVFRQVSPGSSSHRTGKTPTPTTPRQPSSSKTPGSGASSPSRTSRARRSTRRGSSIISASTCGSSSGPAWCWTSPTSSRPRCRRSRCYRSQLVDNQPAGQPGVIDSVCDRTRFWGHMVGVHARRTLRQPRAGRAGEPGSSAALTNRTRISAPAIPARGGLRA